MFYLNQFDGTSLEVHSRKPYNVYQKVDFYLFRSFSFSRAYCLSSLCSYRYIVLKFAGQNAGQQS